MRRLLLLLFLSSCAAAPAPRSFSLHELDCRPLSAYPLRERWTCTPPQESAP